ncbi:MAG: hypothetical protein JNL58_25610 [Planctomyces sp.]|nr:hypothetical protein [Planctomyces sp.]
MNARTFHFSGKSTPRIRPICIYNRLGPPDPGDRVFFLAILEIQGTLKMGMRVRLVYVSVVGLAYILLALWCSFLPESTSQAVGFQLINAGGRSEFLTVYGGMELGFGLVFLMPLRNRSSLPAVLDACVLVHGCLVLFRSISLLQDHHVAITTLVLAANEWLIFLSALYLRKM